MYDMSEKEFEYSASVLLRYVNCNLDNPIPILRNLLTHEFDGFRLDVQSAMDGVCIVKHSDNLKVIPCNDRLTYGILRDDMGSSFRLVDALELPFKIANIALIGEGGWRQALAAVEASAALNRVIFSSFEHSEILQLWSACRDAKCALSWEDDEAIALDHEMLSNLPDELKICISIKAAKARRDFWEPYKSRLVIWGATNLAETDLLGFRPSILIIDCG
jgi:glycerophosphoryl diester phosphodiesterase